MSARAAVLSENQNGFFCLSAAIDVCSEEQMPMLKCCIDSSFPSEFKYSVYLDENLICSLFSNTTFTGGKIKKNSQVFQIRDELRAGQQMCSLSCVAARTHTHKHTHTYWLAGWEHFNHDSSIERVWAQPDI